MLFVEFLFLLVLKQLSVLFCKRDEYSRGRVNKRLSFFHRKPPFSFKEKEFLTPRLSSPPVDNLPCFVENQNPVIFDY